MLPLWCCSYLYCVWASSPIYLGFGLCLISPTSTCYGQVWRLSLQNVTVFSATDTTVHAAVCPKSSKAQNYVLFCEKWENEGRLPSVCLTVIAHWWKQIKRRKQYVHPQAKIEASATKKEKKDFTLFSFRQLISLNVQFMKGCYLWNKAREGRVGCISERISMFLHACTQLSVRVGFYLYIFLCISLQPSLLMPLQICKDCGPFVT